MAQRLNVNINDETAAAIRASQVLKQTTATDVIRRAVSIYQFLYEAQGKGQRIRTVDKNGTITKVHII